ncbi:MAG TPA: hypothetical protein VL588_01400 [Bdellovibrionota bacterium]|jgi:hypothetical protein|nr:hypothetical protein [Bdellovibrionota bacterium]
MIKLIETRSLLRMVWTLALLSFSLMTLAPKPAVAWYEYGGGMGGYMGGYSMAPGLTPFGGNGCQPMMGQMMGPVGGCGGVDPIALNYALNWSGSQQLGASYMPAVGLSALGNSYNYWQLSNSGAFSAR